MNIYINEYEYIILKRKTSFSSFDILLTCSDNNDADDDFFELESFKTRPVLSMNCNNPA